MSSVFGKTLLSIASKYDTHCSLYKARFSTQHWLDMRTPSLEQKQEVVPGQKGKTLGGHFQNGR
eukprot:2890494-Ditylum_brightwellii.AAC.2